MNMNMVQDIMGILNRAYGDQGTAPLDRAAATQIIEYFYSKGMLTNEEVAMIVEAAGGNVIITRDLMEKSGVRLKIWRDDNDNVHMQTREFPDVIKAKVNPNAESRAVDSGPINIDLN